MGHRDVPSAAERIRAWQQARDDLFAAAPREMAGGYRRRWPRICRGCGHVEWKHGPGCRTLRCPCQAFLARLTKLDVEGDGGDAFGRG